MAGSAELKPFAISQTPLGRMGRPVDIANAAAFLASGDAAWIKGQLIPASRGFHLSKKTAIRGVTFAGAERTRE
jgi:NAD(P)-dependent dehydrogenase (short-subunit alcohol dehydrogenase family)